MRPGSDALKTPWLREQLVEHLEHLADQHWLDAALEGNGENLDQVLDFFDDTGVLDAPGGRIGYILHDEAEADLFARLGIAVDDALGVQAAGAVRNVYAWRSVGSVARFILKKLRT